VSYYSVFSDYDPDNQNNRVSVLGNPSLSDVRVMMIGVRNNSSTTKDCIVWTDELRVTDFDESGGWAAKGSLSLAMSDVATINVGGHKETVGFGNVDQSLSERRLDDYGQYNVAVQTDVGRFLPKAAKLKAPVYYSYSKETTTPKYNPLDQDILLKDALDGCSTQAQKDSINAFAVTKKTVESFSISGMKFDVKSKNPMPWDPANFTFSYSSNKQRNVDPSDVYENTSDYRGSLQYGYSPYVKPFVPFKFIKSKSKALKFFKEWEFNYLPSSISFFNNISRYYYEQQTRNETDVAIDLPVSVSKNFLWDRQFSIAWNFTKSLSMTFNSNTTAHIEEPVGAVNKKLFPDAYKNWKDSIWQSIRNLGKPYAYNQTFVLTYKAPFSKIPVLDFITANATYNATYNWERGTVVDNVSSGNTVSNQASLNIDGRMNLEQLYNKIPYLRDVNKRFANATSRDNNAKNKPKKFERTYQLKQDTTFVVKHNMKTKKVKLTATTTDGKPFTLTDKSS
jgi:cell surface protein SprA